ncbi:MAG: sigma-54-dependent Fis family transcriptional regulator [Hellea sp.]|nr:sigma-54-dependent Fis family transcriptional regulator [Hellea sp.]
MKYEILLAEDDDSIRLVLSKALTRAGHNVKVTDNAETLKKWVVSGVGDIVLTDVMMGGREVFDSLPELMDSRPDIPVIVISGNNTVNTAIKTGQHKVFEYIPKPFDLADIIQAVARAGQSVNPRRNRMNAELSKLSMIGRSPAMQPVYRAISRFAAGDISILISGAVGTGKDVIAKLLHDGGERKDRPFLRTTDFSNISLSLQKVNGGDIYIDEIASLTAEQQDGLLAFMTESENIPLSRRPRIISATRKNLREIAERGEFRDDLLFRVNVAEIRLPTLSERGNDVRELAAYFLTKEAGGETRRFQSEALEMLQRHQWAGNIRELENLVRRLALLYSDDVITTAMVAGELAKDIPIERKQEDEQKLEDLLGVACRQTLAQTTPDAKMSPHQIALSWVERPLINEALRLTAGNKAKAADLLGIHRNTLRTKIKTLAIDG